MIILIEINCDKFIYIENLVYTPDATTPVEAARPAQRTPATKLKADTRLVNQLRDAVEAASDEEGWANLSSVGSIITKRHPDFDTRTYGYAKLSDLITATTLFELERRGAGTAKAVYARDKRRQDKKMKPLATLTRSHR